MARDHQLFVGGDHPRGDPARSAADARTVRGVRLRVELDAEPRRLPAHALADRRGALADAGGEDDGVQAAERGGERAELAPDAIDEEFHRELRAGRFGLEELAHIARNSGNAEEPGLLVD